eukprot:750038-Hanusia_phi.AAC.4
MTRRVLAQHESYEGQVLTKHCHRALKIPPCCVRSHSSCRMSSSPMAEMLSLFSCMDDEYNDKSTCQADKRILDVLPDAQGLVRPVLLQSSHGRLRRSAKTSRIFFIIST